MKMNKDEFKNRAEYKHEYGLELEIKYKIWDMSSLTEFRIEVSRMAFGVGVNRIDSRLKSIRV